MTQPSQSAADRVCDVPTYVAQTAALVGLSLPDEVYPQVVENFERIVTIAQPVLDFDLPDTLESAAVFEP